MEIQIYYEDTDCGGVVYYGNYLKYFERARTQYLEERGLSVARLMKEGTVFVVVHAEVDYRSPARYGDRLIIETVVSGMTAASFNFSHVIRERESQRERGLSVARLMKEGTVFVVVHAEVDYRSPARYGDRLIIETVVSGMTAASFTFSHVIRERESQRVVVEGSARLAAVNGFGKVTRLDKAMVAVLRFGSTRSH